MLARTADLLDLAGAVSVPASRRGAPWEEVCRQVAPPGCAPGGERVRRHQHPGPPPDRRPTWAGGTGDRVLATSDELLADLVVAEVVFVLESFFEVPREQLAELVRAVTAFPAVVVLEATMLLRALEVSETERLDFAEAYLVAQAEPSGVGMVASFDKAIDPVATVRWLEPV